MQVGAFMQVMDEDAQAVSKVTGLKLQMAGEVDAPVVLGGFPKSGLDAYVGKLARAGHAVAIDERTLVCRWAKRISKFTILRLHSAQVHNLAVTIFLLQKERPMKNKKVTSSILLSIALLLALAGVAYAAGNIDAANKWAWTGNAGWLNFNPTHGGVTVYSDHLEGYAWAENIGWVRLGTHEVGGAHTYANDGPTTYGVNNDSSGNLSGYAWSANAGWVNFNPTHGQVTIAPATGEFDGYAWGENVGWIHFQNASPAYGVVTAWRGGSSGGDIFLPLIFKNFAPGPDLVVDSLVAAGSAVTVTIRNAGTTATPDAFWVDVYFNPNPAPPGVNQPWQSIAPAGANWGVTTRLNPGQSLTLVTGGAYYVDGSGAFPAGANVYAYVDSINYATATGNILETNEGNNVLGPVISTAGSGKVASGSLSAPAGLPERQPIIR